MDSRKACYAVGARYLSRYRYESHDGTYLGDQEGAGVRENGRLVSRGGGEERGSVGVGAVASTRIGVDVPCPSR